MKKIIVMYAIIVIAGTLGMLMPGVLVRMNERSLNSEKYDLYSNESVVILSPGGDETESAETEPAGKENVTVSEGTLQKRLIELYNMSNAVEYGYTYYYERSMTEVESRETLNTRLHTVLAELETITGGSIMHKADESSSDRVTGDNLIVYSYIGMYNSSTRYFYRVHLIYEARGETEKYSYGAHDLELTFDAETLMIYHVNGYVVSDYTSDDILINYIRHLGITVSRDKNYSRISTATSTELFNGPFNITVTRFDDGYTSFDVTYNFAAVKGN